MTSQVKYYNLFGEQYAESILACPEPELWTTDYAEKGRIYQAMKKRIEQQRALIHEFFNRDFPVLDIGCGFGRHAVLLAKDGFSVTGTDTSNIFIDIARQLFTKHSDKGDFHNVDILCCVLDRAFRQLLLLDVLEHIKPYQRNIVLTRVAEITEKRGILMISVPHVKNRWDSKLNNFRRRITHHSLFFLNREEHPYPIPDNSEIMTLASHNFHLLKLVESADTDYYVFGRN